MLIHTPIPLSKTDLSSVSKFLSHEGRAIVERVVRGQIGAYINKATEITLKTPLDVLAKGPEDPRARDMNIQAAKFKIFLDVLEKLSERETIFEFSKFDVA